MLLLIFLFAFSQAYTFVATKNSYNGTTGYNGLFKACQQEYKSSKPCTIVQLLDGYWNSKTLHRSWVLALDINCVGYTTNATDALGTCIVPSFGQLTVCSCNMIYPICCYY